MYKTIRHGDNSLQYTILPQEEGINVKTKKSRKKGKKILTITIIIIILIIATVGLVTLFSDFFLPKAFEKFSISSLHKAHSGNHVVMLAKKPLGWTNHHNPAHPPVINKTYYINNINRAYKSQEVSNRTASTTTTAATTWPPTKAVQTSTETPTTAMSNEIDRNRFKNKKGDLDKNVLWMYEKPDYTKETGRNYLDISTTTRSSKGNEFLGDGVIRLLNTEIHTTSSPWYHQKWSLGETVSSMRLPESGITPNVMALLVSCGISIICVIVFIVWMRRRRALRKDVEKNSTDAKADDKDILLKESTAGSEDEN